MIAFLAEEPSICRAVIRGAALRHAVRTVDGPFRVWTARSPDLGTGCLLMAAGRDPRRQYAAAALAVRRGAALLVHLGDAFALDPDEGEQDAIVPLAELVDGSGYEAHQLLAPNLSGSAPPKLEPPRIPLSGPGLACATLALPLTIPAWGRALNREGLADIWDLSVSGAGTRAREEEVPLLAWKRVCGATAPAMADTAPSPVTRLGAEAAWSDWGASETMAGLLGGDE